MTKQKTKRNCKKNGAGREKFSLFAKKAIALVLAIFVAVPQLLLPATVGAAPVGTSPATNPPLQNSCGLDIVLVLDNSTSIDATEIAQEKSAFLGLVSDLSGTPTEFSVVSFGTTAAVKRAFTNDIALVNGAINSINYNDYAATNWQDALIKIKNNLPNRENNQNLVIFASDGDPTINNSDLNSNNLPINGNNWSITDRNDLENAIIAANEIKTGYNTRIITLGVGAAVTRANLEKISSADAYYAATDFVALGTLLKTIASDLCGGTITVSKFIGKEGNWVPAGAGWEFNVGGTVAETKAENGGKTDSVSLDAGIYSITETPQSGYNLVNGVCAVSNNNGAAAGTFDLAASRIKDVNLGILDIVSCSFYNEVVCQKNYGAETCFKDGWAKKDYTWNYPEFCEAAGAEEYEKHPDCDCVETAKKDCTGAGTSLTTYSYNYSYCAAKEPLANENDPACESAWTCQDWTNAECVSSDEGGRRKQTQSCTDQFGGQKTNEQIVNDAACGCSRTETGRACVADGTARVEYSRSGQSYCSGSFTAEESDESCSCGYSPWQNRGCDSDGKMGQIRTQTTDFNYCADLTREIEDSSCAQCAAWSDWGACSVTCDGGTKTRTCVAGGLIGNTESAECKTQSCEEGGSVCGNGVKETGEECDGTANCTANCTFVAAGECSTACGQAATEVPDGQGGTKTCAATVACQSGGSSGGSTPGTSGQYMPGYGPTGGITPQVAGASTEKLDFDEIQKRIDAIRKQINDISNQINNKKGVLGDATMVKTGVLDVIVDDADRVEPLDLPEQPEFGLRKLKTCSAGSKSVLKSIKIKK